MSFYDYFLFFTRHLNESRCPKTFFEHLPFIFYTITYYIAKRKPTKSNLSAGPV